MKSSNSTTLTETTSLPKSKAWFISIFPENQSPVKTRLQLMKISSTARKQKPSNSKTQPQLQGCSVAQEICKKQEEASPLEEQLD